MAYTPRLLVAAGLSLAIAASGLAITPTLAQAAPTAAGAYVSLMPTRVLDTRQGTAIPAGGTITVDIAGRGGVPATGVSAVTVNLTVTQSTSNGFLTAYPADGARPTASTLNYAPGQTVPNLATVKVSADGKIKITNTSSGTAHVMADVAGYYRAGAPTAPGTFTSLTPTRVLDTRTGIGAAGPVPAGGAIGVQMAGRGGIPATGVAAVVLNLTVTESTSNGFLTAYPSGTTRPNASNLNYAPGQTVPNMATVKLGADGKINIANTSNGTAHVVADIAGYYLAGTPTVEGAFVSLNPTRIVDSRAGHWALQPRPGNTVVVQIAGRGGVPRTGASAVVMNTTVTETQAAGSLVVYPDAVSVPKATNLNYGPGETVANMVHTGLSANGQVDISSTSTGSTAVIADLAGYFLGPQGTPSGSTTPSAPVTPPTTATPSAPASTATPSPSAPATPTQTPTVPVTPTTPATTPTQPSETPTTPATTPTQPSETPTTPATTPSDTLPAGAGVPWDDTKIWETTHNSASQNNNPSAISSILEESVEKDQYNGKNAFFYNVLVKENTPGVTYHVTLYVNGKASNTFTSVSQGSTNNFTAVFYPRGVDQVTSVYAVIS